MGLSAAGFVAHQEILEARLKDYCEDIRGMDGQLGTVIAANAVFIALSGRGESKLWIIVAGLLSLSIFVSLVAICAFPVFAPGKDLLYQKSLGTLNVTQMRDYHAESIVKHYKKNINVRQRKFWAFVLAVTLLMAGTASAAVAMYRDNTKETSNEDTLAPPSPGDRLAPGSDPARTAAPSGAASPGISDGP